MNTVADEYRVPRAGPASSRRVADRDLVAVTRAASALVKSGDVIPPARKEVLLKVCLDASAD
jgi:hypothetical protein